LSIRQSWGLPVPLPVSQTTALVLAAAVCFFAVAVAGCGGGGGTAAGASVNVYVSAPLCAGAKRELANSGGRPGDVRVRVVCLADTEADNRLDLATIGANARRATEDSSSIAYIGELDPSATRFSHPILEAAGISQLSNQSGSAAMTKLLSAIKRASGSSSLREAVADELSEH
jgi:branched-chain amino acid transport system substrate-binding protein